MVAYTKPKQRKKEESEQLRGERNKIKLIVYHFEERPWWPIQSPSQGRKKKAKS